jgi:hypothetical protein
VCEQLHAATPLQQEYTGVLYKNNVQWCIHACCSGDLACTALLTGQSATQTLLYTKANKLSFLLCISAATVCNSGETHHGKWTADEDRSVVLVWDNSYSLVRSKTLAYKVYSMYSLH